MNSRIVIVLDKWLALCGYVCRKTYGPCLWRTRVIWEQLGRCQRVVTQRSCQKAPRTYESVCRYTWTMIWTTRPFTVMILQMSRMTISLLWIWRNFMCVGCIWYVVKCPQEWELHMYVCKIHVKVTTRTTLEYCYMHCIKGNVVITIKM